MAENGPIEEIAKIVSRNLFERFGWQQFGPYDQDFSCIKEDKHKPKDKKQKHTHPVDVVFSYKDPYLNKMIYLNTDLKSYGKATISSKNVEDALSSLAATIECASYNKEWSDKYISGSGRHEVRGMLFVYNHDNRFDGSFYDFFYPPKPSGNQKRKARAVKFENIKLPKNKMIHIVEPDLINYMITVVTDLDSMIAKKTFPDDDYGFYYPQLTYHKVAVSDENLPATIDVLSAPYMIIKHGPVITYAKGGEETKHHDGGYVVYYNRPGKDDLEFIYLLDALSKYQILDGRNKIRIRVVSKDVSGHIRSAFNRAIEKFYHEWGLDDKAKAELEEIDLHLVSVAKEFYSSQDIGWR
jgi:hypothetical protein